MVIKRRTFRIIAYFSSFCQSFIQIYSVAPAVSVPAAVTSSVFLGPVFF